jgi:hypothetical protein
MKKILDPKNLPYFGALVQAVLFSSVGNKFFPAYGWLVGLGVGAVVNYSIALASSRYSEIAEKRKPLARLALLGMFLLSPITITCTLFIPKSIVTAIAWAMCVDGSIILAGAIAGKSLMVTERKTKVARKAKKVSATLPKETEPLHKLARKRIADNDLLAYLAEKPGQSQELTAAHFGVTRQAIGSRLKSLYAVKNEKVTNA